MGVTRVFFSMFSVEETREEVLSYFKDLIIAAHENDLKASLDVNPMCFEKLELHQMICLYFTVFM